MTDLDEVNREGDSTLSGVVKHSHKCVIGVMHSRSFKGTIDITNNYAVTFEEDDNDHSIWFIDHNFHEVEATDGGKKEGGEVVGCGGLEKERCRDGDGVGGDEGGQR
ncbi:hypothetical protein LguiA_027023 [Lonicera macranthoides]